MDKGRSEVHIVYWKTPPPPGGGEGRGQPTSHRSKKRKKITRRRGEWERKTKVKRIICTYNTF